MRPTQYNDFNAATSGEASVLFNFKPTLHAACPATAFKLSRTTENVILKKIKALPGVLSRKLGK